MAVLIEITSWVSFFWLPHVDHFKLIAYTELPLAAIRRSNNGAYFFMGSYNNYLTETKWMGEMYLRSRLESAVEWEEW